MERKIIHVDMDAFFAAVEIKDNPSLRGKPVIVGGTSERGVVSTCSYEARKFGVRSAMPVYIAKDKCPNGIFILPRMYRYKEISAEIFEVFYKITPLVEPLSIDEAYLDVTHIDEDTIKIAMRIKEEVRRKTGLTLSVGISYNKFLAKLASDWNKPNGMKVITKDMIPEVLFPLPISKVYGLGEKSVKKLNNIGVFTIKELYNLPFNIFVEYFGKYGVEVYERIRGIDKREVTPTRERKSIGRETTLRKDTDNKRELNEYIEGFAISIAKSLNSKGIKGKTLTIKIKTSSFDNHTRSKTLPYYISSKEELYEEGIKILNDIELDETIRLIGLSISSLEEKKEEQLKLF